MNPKYSAFLRLAPVLLAFTGFACGGGGGGGGGTGGSDTLNEGVYDVTSFGYVDPKPQSYQPLTKPTFAAVRCDEVAVLVGDADKSFEVDDKKTYDANGISYPKIPSEATAGLAVIQAIHPDIDGDGRPDLVVLGRVGASGSAILRVNILTFVNAQWVKIGTFDCNTAGDHFENESATLSYGDVDGDGREEIIVAATLDTDSWVRVYEDPIQGAGFGVIAKNSRSRTRPTCERSRRSSTTTASPSWSSTRIHMWERPPSTSSTTRKSSTRR